MFRQGVRRKVVYILPNIVASRNTTRFQRMLSLSGAFDLIALLECGPVPEELKAGARFLVNPVRRKLLRTLVYPFWCIYVLFRIRKDVGMVISSFQEIPLIMGYFGKKLTGKRWVADIYDHPALSSDIGDSVPLFKRMVLKAYSQSTGIISRRLLKKADVVLCTLVPEALEGYGIPQDRIVPLTNGVELQSLSERPLQPVQKEAGRNFRVLYVGFVLRIRGIDVILDAATVLKRRCPDLEWVLVGKSHREEENWLKSQIGHRELEGTVRFLGELPHSDVLNLISGSDACLFTFPKNRATDWIFPVKIFEYMAHGKPIIATGLRGVRQVLELGRSALLIEPGEATALAEAAAQLYLDRGLGRLLGENARKEVSKYDWSEINKKLVNALR